MRLRVLLDVVVAVLVLTVLTCLPMLAGGCAAARANAGTGASTAGVPGGSNFETAIRYRSADQLLASPSAQGLSYVIPPSNARSITHCDASAGSRSNAQRSAEARTSPS